MFIGGDNVKVTHLEILEKRYDLDRDQQIQLDKERKGRIGEYYLKSLIETKLNPEISVISDYRFEVNGSECQIDFLILLNQSCIIIEVKNYYGDFEIRPDGFYRLNPLRKIKHPFSQVERAEIMLHSHLKRLNLNLNIKYYVVFVNEQFSLYCLTRDMPVVMASQLNRFLDSLNEEVYDKKHEYIVRRLEDSRLLKSRYELELNLDFNKAKKGLACQYCSGWLEVDTYKQLKCQSCGTREEIESAIGRSITELETLFPSDEITLRRLLEWIDHTYSPSKLRRLLKEICHTHGSKKGRYYTLKSNTITTSNG